MADTQIVFGVHEPEGHGKAGFTYRAVGFISFWVLLNLGLWIHVTAFDYASDDFNLLHISSVAESVRAAQSVDKLGIGIPDPASRLNFRLTQPFVFLISRKIFGLNPLPLHWSSLILHICNGLLLFGICMRVFRREVIGALTVMIWGFWPGNAVSIAWIINHCDLLCALFSLVATYAFLRSLEQANRLKRKAWYCTALIAIALAVLSKENALPLAVCLMLIAYTQNRSWKAALTKTWPLFLPAAGYVMLIAETGRGFLTKAAPGIHGSGFLSSVSVKLAHYLDAILLLLLPLPAFPSALWGVSFTVLAALISLTLLIQRSKMSGDRPMQALALAAAIMLTPAAITDSLRVLYVPSAAFAMMAAWIGVRSIEDNNIGVRAVVLMALGGMLTMEYAMGRRISEKFAPSADFVRSDLCTKIKAGEILRDAEVARYASSLCERTQCCSPVVSAAAGNIYLNNYYEDRVEWVRTAKRRILPDPGR